MAGSLRCGGGGRYGGDRRPARAGGTGRPVVRDRGTNRRQSAGRICRGLGPASRTCVFRRPRLHSRRHRHQQHAGRQIRVEPRGQRPGTAVHRSCCVGQRLGCRCVVGRARHRHGRAHRTRRRHLDRSRSGSGIRDRVVASDVGDILGQGTGADRVRRRPAGGGQGGSPDPRDQPCPWARTAAVATGGKAAVWRAAGERPRGGVGFHRGRAGRHGAGRAAGADPAAVAERRRTRPDGDIR